MPQIITWILQHSTIGGLVLAVAVIVSAFAWNYYEAVVKEDGRDRDELLKSLSKGGGPRALYVDRMTLLLDRLDGLMGDAGQGQRRVARWLGLKTPRPCWTGRPKEADLRRFGWHTGRPCLPRPRWSCGSPDISGAHQTQ